MRRASSFVFAILACAVLGDRARGDDAPIAIDPFDDDKSLPEHAEDVVDYTIDASIDTAKHTGDLIVTVEVQVPTSLTDQQREAIEAVATATTVSPRAHLEA